MAAPTTGGMILHLPFGYSVDWSSAAEVMVLATYLAFAIGCDYLWFILNPAFGLGRFPRGEVWWYSGPWIGRPAMEYYLAVAASSPWRRSPGRSDAAPRRSPSRGAWCWAWRSCASRDGRRARLPALVPLDAAARGRRARCGRGGRRRSRAVRGSRPWPTSTSVRCCSRAQRSSAPARSPASSSARSPRGPRASRRSSAWGRGRHRHRRAVRAGVQGPLRPRQASRRRDRKSFTAAANSWALQRGQVPRPGDDDQLGAGDASTSVSEKCGGVSPSSDPTSTRVGAAIRARSGRRSARPASASRAGPSPRDPRRRRWPGPRHGRRRRRCDQPRHEVVEERREPALATWAAARWRPRPPRRCPARPGCPPARARPPWGGAPPAPSAAYPPSESPHTTARPPRIAAMRAAMRSAKLSTETASTAGAAPRPGNSGVTISRSAASRGATAAQRRRPREGVQQHEGGRLGHRATLARRRRRRDERGRGATVCR